MEVVLLAFIILTGYHLYVENVVVSAREDSLRLKLHLLLVRTSKIMEETNDHRVKKIAEELNQMILITAHSLRWHNYMEFKLYKFKHAHRSKELQEAHKAKYDAAFTKDPELKGIFNEYGSIIKKAFEHSATGWYIYLFPFILLYRGMKAILNKSDQYTPEVKIAYKARSFEKYKDFEMTYSNQLTTAKKRCQNWSVLR